LAAPRQGENWKEREGGKERKEKGDGGRREGGRREGENRKLKGLSEDELTLVVWVSDLPLGIVSSPDLQ
jgi:hypothetical protein